MSRGGQQPFAAWGIFGDNGTTVPYNFTAGDYGSYGENGWIQNPVGSGGQWQGNQFPEYYWKTPYVKDASQVPAFLGAVWMHSVVGTYGVAAPQTESSWYDSESGGLGRVMLNRHNGYVGSCFLDFSARMVGLKELLKLKWHRQFDTNSWYDLQADVGWPEWLADYEDF